MSNHITVDAALKKANNMITIPSMITMFALMFLSYFLGNIDIISKGIVPIGFLSGIIAGWMVWSFQVPKWKIWAYQRVQDIDELKRQAVESRIIWKDKSIFTKTEIWTQEQKKEYDKIIRDHFNKY